MLTYIKARTAEEWNLPAYRGKGGHVESYFLKGNDPETLRAFWIKFTIYAPLRGNPLGEVWAILFDPHSRTVIGAKESYLLSECSLEGGKPIRMGHSTLSSTSTEGKIHNGEGKEIRWSLSFRSELPPLVLFPSRLMYHLPLPRSKTVTPHPYLLFSGTIHSPLGEWAFRNAPGCQGHNWGKEHAFSYAWVHCNLWEKREGIVFEGLSARVKVGKRILPPLSLGALILPGGKTLFFRGIKALTSRDIHFDPTTYRFSLRGEFYTLEGEARMDPQVSAGLTYLNPDGTPGYCLNSKTSDLVLKLINSDGRVVEEFRSHQTSALEILVRDPDHPVKMIL